MNKNIYKIGIALLTACATPSFAQVSNDNEDEVNKIDTRWVANDYVPGQVLVKFKDTNRIQVRRAQGRFTSTDANQVTTVLKKYGTEVMEQLLPNQNPHRQMRRSKAYNGTEIQEHDLSQLYCVTLSADHQDEVVQVVEELKTLDEVEFAEPNYRIYMMADTHIADSYSNNPMESQQWYLDDYGVKELWNKPVINKERPVIAILDTGVDLTHPDLKDNLWTNNIEAYGTKDNDNDGNGFNNDVHGWDFVNNSPNIRDNNMHGTHVAGIAAAANNGIGIIGANPQALIMPITVLQSDGMGDIATIIKGIDYAVANGATVLNMSLGTYINSLALRQALESAYQQAVLVAAAGNDGRCINSSHWNVLHFDPEPQSMPCFPAAYSFVLGVQATEKGGSVATFSNYDDNGALFSDVSTFWDPDGFNYELKVPGKKILSTIPGGGYKELSGTSMAAPLVAGAISALKMVKHYDTHEILWGDLLHTENIAQACNMTKRPAELDLQKIMLRERKELTEMEEEDYGGDNEVDAGETVSIYPVIRSTFGAANNIKMKLVVDEFEDPSVVEILSDWVDFGLRLDAYGKAMSRNPLLVKISNNVADNRHIRLKVIATCDEITEEVYFPITLIAHHMIKLSGLLNENTTLTADHVYFINGALGVNKGVTLTIEPGTRLEFAAGASIRSFGKLVAKGTSEKPIVFTRHASAGSNYWGGINTHAPEGIHNHTGIYTNADNTQFTLLTTEDTPIMIKQIFRKVYYGVTEKSPSKRFELYDYMGGDGWNCYTPNMSGKEHLFTDPSYLTPAIMKMIADMDTYCSQFPTEPTGDKTEAAGVDAMLLEHEWATYDNNSDTVSFCRFEYADFQGGSREYPVVFMNDCHLDNCANISSINGMRNVVINGTASTSNPAPRYNNAVMYHTNYVNNQTSGKNLYSYFYKNNFFNNFGKVNKKTYMLGFETNAPTIDHATLPSYLGSSREDLIRPYIYEFGNADNTWGSVDLSNMPDKPYSEAHGIVWKVLVNGKDAQDEFEDLAPLGVGKHKFEVYFNRPMNKAVAPQITFGTRPPYTQQTVGEDGSWNAEGTVYTAYKTITGRTMSDGLNRIYVQGAEDDEHVPCPYENTRFNVILQAAGSMATGFAAEAGLGKVTLVWDRTGHELDEVLGINVYRYQQRTVPASWKGGTYTSEYVVNDTIQLNQEILDPEATSFTDHDVTPGEVYYYFYKLMSTDLQALDMSNTVTATPLTSTRGDANGSGNVDVADIITTVNYITFQNPQPFIFEAADVNEDNVINLLDVTGIVRIINPGLTVESMMEASATYSIEDGVLYVESDVALGGVQVQLTLDGRGKMSDVRTAADLDGFEHASAWLSDNDYLFLAYSLNGKTLVPGKHALLYIGDAQIASLCLSDAQGRNVKVFGNDVTSVSRMGSNVKHVKGIYDLQGRKLSTINSQFSTLKKGIYIINGEKFVK